MKITPENKKKVITFVMKIMRLADPSGFNEKKYKDMFGRMNDTEFKDWCSGIVDWSKDFNNDRVTLKLTEVPYENPINLDNIKAACESINVPLFERIALPFVSQDSGEVYWTPTKTLVGYTHTKVLQQLRIKKNSQSIDTGARDPITGQSVRDSKNARSSDMENIGMLTIGGIDEILDEFMTIRSDDLIGKRKSLSNIRLDGRCSLKECEANKKNSVALNTLDVLFMACGLKTDLITDGLLLKSTLDQKSIAVNTKMSSER